MADKIDQLTIDNVDYDIDLPVDATPSIASLETNVKDTTNSVSRYKGDLAMRKVYTGVLGVANGSATADKNTYANQSFYFLTVKPLDWNAVWTVKYRLNIHLDNQSQTYKSSASATAIQVGQLERGTYECEWSGSSGAYHVFKFFQSQKNTSYRPIYYHMLHNVTQAGFNANYGHKIGVSLTSSYLPTPTTDYSSGSAVTTNFSRTIEVIVDEAINCEVSLNDHLEVEADARSYGDLADTTNYPRLSSTYYATNTSASNSAGRWINLAATTQGLYESADDNTYTYTQQTYNYLKNGTYNGTTALRILGYSLIGFDKDGNALGISVYSTSQSSNTNGISNASTRKYCTVGFDYTKGIRYTNSSSVFAAGGDINISSAINYSAIDFRYTDNCVASSAATTLGLVIRQPVYLRGTIGDDGLFYLAPITVTYSNVSYQRAWVQPSDGFDEGYVYWFIGYPYYNSSYVASGYQLNLITQGELVEYKNGALKPYGAGPQTYIKSASKSGSTLTLTKQDDTTVTFDDTNTTYTFAEGTTNGAFSVTPLGGSAQSVKIHGLATVATSGAYGDLSGTPTIGNATLTIKKNGTAVDTFTANATSDKDINITVPTKVSDLSNDSGFTTNTGTITGITMNGASKGTSGVVDLGTVITSHQDISGKLDKTGGTVTGTLVLSKNTDLSGTANNSPALIIGGAATAEHIEIDSNEIQAKATGTTTSNLYINGDGGNVYFGPKTTVNNVDYRAYESGGYLYSYGTKVSVEGHTHSYYTKPSGGIPDSDLASGSTFLKTAVTKLGTRTGDITIATLKSDLGLGSAAYVSTGTSSGNVPVLDSNGKLSTSVLPALAISDTFVVASQSAMLGLTAQVGDIAVRTDVNKSYILKTDGASTLANWQELLTPTDAVQSVNGNTGTVVLSLDDVADGSTRKLANYMPLSGGTFTGTIKFNSTSLPSKSLSYIMGIDAFANGGEAGWQSKSDFLSGYVTGSSLTADQIVLGNSNSTIKISSYKPTASGTTWDDTSDVNIPTMKAIKNYVTGLGYTSSSGTITGVSVNGTSVATSGVANITSVPWSIISSKPSIPNNASTSGVTAANATTNNGFYYISANGQYTPPFKQVDSATGSDYRIITSWYSANWYQQIATDFRSNDIFIRRNQNGTLFPWTPIVKLQPCSGTTTQTMPTITDNAIARFDTTHGATIQNSAVTIDDNGNIAGVGTLNGLTLPSSGTLATQGWVENKGYVTSSGVTSVATGAGLTGGTITGTGTVKANLNSETSLGTIGTTSKLYAVGVDSNGKLCVNVPWSDNNTNYYHTTGSWSGLTYTATANGGAGALAFTIPTGTDANSVAVGNHTHSYIPLSGTSALAGNIVPTTNDIYALGSSTNGMGYVYTTLLSSANTWLTVGWDVNDLPGDGNNGQKEVYVNGNYVTINTKEPEYGYEYSLVFGSYYGPYIAATGSSMQFLTNSTSYDATFDFGGWNPFTQQQNKTATVYVNGNKVPTNAYEHNINLFYSGQLVCRFQLRTNSSTALTYSTLCGALYNAGYNTANTKCLMASGMVYVSTTTTCIVTGVYATASGTTLGVCYTSLVSTSSQTGTIKTAPDVNSYTTKTLSSSYTVNDYVRTL